MVDHKTDQRQPEHLADRRVLDLKDLHQHQEERELERYGHQPGEIRMLKDRLNPSNKRGASLLGICGVLRTHTNTWWTRLEQPEPAESKQIAAYPAGPWTPTPRGHLPDVVILWATSLLGYIACRQDARKWGSFRRATEELSPLERGFLSVMNGMKLWATPVLILIVA